MSDHGQHASPPPGSAAAGLRPQVYTAWSRRVLALLIDFIGLAAIGNVGRVMGWLTAYSGLGWLVGMLGAVAYLIWNYGHRQGTTGSSIGKSVLHFKVISEKTGAPIGFGRSIARQLAHVVDALICYVGYLFPLWDAKRQTLADRIMGTVCVARRRITDGRDTGQPGPAGGHDMPGAGPLRARAAILCGFPDCGQTAAMVELIPKGAAYADGENDILHEFDSVFSGKGTFRVSDFLPFVDYSIDVPDYEDAVAAVRGGGDDVAKILNGRGKLYAPFFCAGCGLSYCAVHWKLEPVFDELGFDYYTGRCPVGHKKSIDH